MADTATGVADFEYQTKVEDIAPATKKVTIEIPGDRIATKLSENLVRNPHQGRLSRDSVPVRLLRSSSRSDSAPISAMTSRRQLISESYQQAIEKNKLDVVGEPEFDNPESIKLPDSGPLSFSFQVEIRPTFTLPELKDIPVKRAKVEVNDTHIEQAMKNLREQQGALVPVEDRGLEAKDYVSADVSIKFEGKEIGAQQDSQFIVQSGRIGGIFIEDLEKQLAGTKVGESKTITVKAPEDHPKEEIRGKEVQIDIAVKGIKKLELAEINDQFLESLGFTNEQELKDALKEQMDLRIRNDVQQAMRDQVSKYLMDNIQLEVPAKMSARQTQRIIQRRASDLLMRGMPANEIEANIEKIKAGADEQAAAELKAFFVLDKVAEQFKIDVSDGELNQQVAMAAMQSGERPEKLKQELAKNGTLQSMYLRLRENKALDKILESAKIEDVAVEDKKA